MSGISTAKRCGMATSSASMRAITSNQLAASPWSSAGPRPPLAGSGTNVTGTRLEAWISSRHAASSSRTGPSRTITTWSGRTVWSSTALRSARLM